MDIKTDEKLLTAEDVSQYLGVNIETVWRYCREGSLKFFKFNRFYRFKKEDVENFIENSN